MPSSPDIMLILPSYNLWVAKKLNEKVRYPDILCAIGRWQEERGGVSLPQGEALHCCAEAWRGCLFPVVYIFLKARDYLNPWGQYSLLETASARPQLAVWQH